MSAEPGGGETSVVPKEPTQEPMEEDPAEGNNGASAAADVPIAQEEVNNVTFQNRLQQLREKELDNGLLSVDEYIELFLAEVVQNDNYARQTLARGKQQYPKESMFISVQGFLSFNYADDFTSSLKKIKAVRKRLPKFERYITEIQNRIFAYGIASIANCYTTIKISTLANVLDMGNNENEMANLINDFKWTVANNIVQVSNTPEIQAFVNDQISPEFGRFNGFEKFKTYENLGRRKEHPIDNLKKLMIVSDTLSKINLPPITGEQENTTEDKPTYSLA
uniref:CSN8/PSMD8/EIF3K domain-containing protein n=1 Tax=Panagrolaimus sp. PS1159 TaxID=55785 RepID=A0AC35F5E7_9BILA